MSNVVNFDRLERTSEAMETVLHGTLNGMITATECSAMAKAGYAIAKAEEVKLKGRLFHVARGGKALPKA